MSRIYIYYSESLTFKGFKIDIFPQKDEYLMLVNNKTEFKINENEFKINTNVFNKFYNKLLNLNFKEIISENQDISGYDGSTLTIRIGNFQNNLTIDLWSIGYNTKNRKLEELHNILKEIIDLANLNNMAFNL
jgi:hypothetical protein